MTLQRDVGAVQVTTDTEGNVIDREDNCDANRARYFAGTSSWESYKALCLGVRYRRYRGPRRLVGVQYADEQWVVMQRMEVE